MIAPTVKRRRTSRSRRGAGLAQAIIVLGATCSTIGLTLFVGPRVLLASGGNALPDLEPTQDHHALALAALGAILEDSKCLAAAHGGDGSPQQLVLWFADADADGHPAANEIVVITHLASSGTLAAHSIANAGDAPTVPVRLTHDLIASKAFAERWTFRADVEARVITSGLAAFEVAREVEGDGGDTGNARVTLTWTTPADAPDVGRITVPLAMMTAAED